MHVSTSPAAPIDASYLTQSANGVLSAEYVLTAGTNITLTPGAGILTIDAAGGSGAPVGATYIVQTPDGTLTNEQALSALATGLLKNTTTTGVLSIGIAGTDYPGLAFANVFTAANIYQGATSSITPLTVKTTNDDDAKPLFRLINSIDANLSYFDSEGKLYFLENGPSIASGKNAIWFSSSSGSGIRIQSTGSIKLRPNNAASTYEFTNSGLLVDSPTKDGKISARTTSGSMDGAALSGEQEASPSSGHFYGVRGHVAGAGGGSKSAGYFSSAAAEGDNHGVYVANINTSSGGNYAIRTNAGLIQLGDRATISQPSTTAAVPTLKLTQADLSEEFIRFEATVGAGNPIELSGIYFARAYVETVGAKYMPLFDSVGAQAAIDALTDVAAATDEWVLTKDTASGNAIFKAAAGGSSLPVADTQTIVMGSADNTKLFRIEVDGFTEGATRVMTPPNQNFLAAGLDVAQTFTVTNTFTGNLLAYKNGEATNFLAGNAGNATMTGTYNVGVGEVVMADATSATQNMAVGAFALQHITEGTLNMALGYQALLSLTTGNKNTATGTQALNSITTTDSNTGVGYLAGASNTGARGTFIGARAGHGSTGSDSVLIGYLAGFSTTASNVLYIANNETETPLIYGEFDNARLVNYGYFEVLQQSTTRAKPVIKLQQADLSEEFIRFESTVGAGNPIDTAAIGAYYGKVRVYVEGVGAKFMALYDS